MPTTYKIYLLNKDSTPKEIRIREDTEEFPCYDFRSLYASIRRTFLKLQGKNFVMQWEDSEGDKILLANQEDFRFFNRASADMKKIYIKEFETEQKKSSFQREGQCHPGVVCDSCDINVVGFRYKCIQCDDYDLCPRCEALGFHPEHYMIRLPEPLSIHFKEELRNALELCYKIFYEHCPKVGQNKANPSQDKSDHKSDQTYKSNFKTCNAFVLPNIEIGIEIDPHSPSTSQTEKADKKESNKNESPKQDDSEKFPEGKILVDDKTNGNVSNTTINENLNSSVIKTEAQDEWTFIDNNDTISHASSVISSATEGNERQISLPTSPSAPELSSNRATYPELPKERETVHHPNPNIQKAIETMIDMGFSNRGGLLANLLEVENGDINKVLDIYQPDK